jgi:hypothetical protein
MPLSMAQVFIFMMSVVMSQILLMESFATITNQEVIRKRELVSDNSPKTRTAIVYLTKALDDCRAIRLGHLLQTVPPNMDVWLLHNHNIMKSKADQAKLTTSINHVHRLEREHRFYTESQGKEKITCFDDRPSGPAKSSFLRWVVAHPEYKHAWHMEDDTFFTGEWNHFFAQADTEADFVGAQFTQMDNWVYFRDDRCSMDQNYVPSSNETKSNNTLNGRIMCRDVLTWRTLWSMVRLSNQFAQFLLDDLESGNLQGHHEAIVQGVLMGHANLTFMDLPPLVGSNEAGDWGRYKIRTNSSLDLYQPVKDNRFYHPLKCEAYTGEKLDHFKRIMMTYGWSNGTL